jgi:hypothetical protein
VPKLLGIIVVLASFDSLVGINNAADGGVLIIVSVAFGLLLLLLVLLLALVPWSLL